MTPAEQRAHTPWTVFWSLRATGKVQAIRVAQLLAALPSADDLRKLMNGAASNWGALSGPQRDAWNEAAAALPTPTSGYNYHAVSYVTAQGPPWDPPETPTVPEDYYIQNDAGKICLTRRGWSVPYENSRLAPYQQKMRDAVAAWETLTPEEQRAWGKDPEAKRRVIPGRNLFISRFIRGLI